MDVHVVRDRKADHLAVEEARRIHELPRNLAIVQKRVERARCAVPRLSGAHSSFETIRGIKSNGRMRSVPRESA